MRRPGDRSRELGAATVRSLRPGKPGVDPRSALGVVREPERTPSGGRVMAVTVFLAGAECPFACVFCDLWRYTLDGPTPPGALVGQLERALAGVDPVEPGARLKLYNASNFFDRRAVPPEDLAVIARLADRFDRVVVECHPRLVGEEAVAFAGSLAGELEVAMGLETVHPEALARLGKGMELADFDRAADFLARHGVALRAFVLVGAPWVPPEEGAEWAARSVEHAVGRGAETVSLIPVRGGNGALERLEAEGCWRAPTLGEIEAATDAALEVAGGAVVSADPWDLERFVSCAACRQERLARLRRIHLGGEPQPRVECAECGGR